MNPTEFSDVDLGFIDIDDNAEYIVKLPEVAADTLISNTAELPGYVYAVGKSTEGKIGIYKLENKLIEGSGRLSFKNVEGLSRSPKSVRDSLHAAFNYFSENCMRDFSGHDFTLYYNDLQNRGVSDEVSVAEVVGLFSALSGQPVKPAAVICGRVVMSGSMMAVETDIEEMIVAAHNAGAKTLLLPEDCMEKYEHLSFDLKRKLDVIYYSSPVEAARKAIEV